VYNDVKSYGGEITGKTARNRQIGWNILKKAMAEKVLLCQ
jgi:hypothetical protein